MRRSTGGRLGRRGQKGAVEGNEESGRTLNSRLRDRLLQLPKQRNQLKKKNYRTPSRNTGTERSRSFRTRVRECEGSGPEVSGEMGVTRRKRKTAPEMTCGAWTTFSVFIQP